MPEGPEEYGFEAYRASLSRDWYADDPLLHRLLDRYAPGADRSRLETFGPRAAGELRQLAETSARPENAPRLLHRDAYDQRVDAIELPASTRDGLRIAHGEEGLGAVRGDPFVHYAMIYLLAQNGEAGVACSVACTDGLVRALRPLRAGHGSEADAIRRALADVLDSSASAYAHAAQFVTEIQGGSDVPANRVRAIREDGERAVGLRQAGLGQAGAAHAAPFRIHGQKWFCSNINADWFLVTARAESAGSGAGGEPGSSPAPGTVTSPRAVTSPVALFLVPAFVDGRRNGYTIDRLKDKLGTRELATAEVTFAGAAAWPVGSPELGLSMLLRHVLTPSRYACVLFAAGALRRAERVAGEYAAFREAFGRPIAEYPLVRNALDGLAAGRRRALVVAFELLRLWEAAEASGYRGTAAADFRVLLSLAKPVLTRRATEGLHEAMMVLGGNGIEERFSPLPRLYRDSAIMETWEGPHNVLFTQAVRDMRRFDMGPAAFLERVAGGADAAARRELAVRLRTAIERGVGEGTTIAEGAGAGKGGDAGKPAVAMSELAPAILDAVAEGRDESG